MGFFSWKTSDTNKSISNKYSDRGALSVYLLCPNGDKIYEDNYEGYGIFGGYDVYELLAKWNKPEISNEEARVYGINIAFGNEPSKYTLKFVENKNLNYEDVQPSERCEYQGYYYE